MSSRTIIAAVLLVASTVLCNGTPVRSQEEAQAVQVAQKFGGNRMSARENFIETQIASAVFSCDFKAVRFAEVLDDLKTRFNVPIFIDDSVLDQGLDEDSRITLEIDGVNLATGLRLLLKPYQCTVRVNDGVAWVVSDDHALAVQELRMYDCKGLASKIGGNPTENSEKLVSVVTTMIEPQSWLSTGGEGTISEIDGKLIVRQNHRAHAQIGALLHWLDDEFSK